MHGIHLYEVCVHELHLQITLHKSVLKCMNSRHQLNNMKLLQYVPLSWENGLLEQQR